MRLAAAFAVSLAAALGVRLAPIAILATALAVAGCGSTGRAPDRGGSTLRSTYADADGGGVLGVAAGEPLRDRTPLGPRAKTGRELARFAYVTDAHVRDEESPARAPFLDRLGAPFTSVFRPQESLTAQVLVAAVRSIDRFAPRAVVEGGDLADSSQRNELAAGVAALNGGVVDPDSGARGYDGIQAASDPDPFYYRPGVDSPRHAGLLRAAQRPFRSPGLRAPWFPVTGNHDLLVDGEIAPTPATRALATGGRAPDALPRGVRVPRDAAQARTLLDGLLPQIVPGAPRVAADPAREELGERAVGVLRRAAHAPGTGARLDYTFDLGPRVRAIVLDTVRRDAGSDGIVSAEQVAFLRTALRDAGTRWVIVFSHQPLAGAEGGQPAVALLDRHPRVLATIAGHTHRNRIMPRRTPAGGYWQIQTASLADYPQQARALRVLATAGGGAVIETWMLDTAPGRSADVARELAYLDAQGGRPADDAGGVTDRNVRLWRAPPKP
jgi:3',5'-cyclic AMP phosphodiesterase CpdA